MLALSQARIEFVLTGNISSLFHPQTDSQFNPPSYFSFFQLTLFRQSLSFPLLENGELRDWIPVFLCALERIGACEMLDALLTSLTLIPQSGFSSSSCFTPVSSSSFAWQIGYAVHSLLNFDCWIQRYSSLQLIFFMSFDIFRMYILHRIFEITLKWEGRLRLDGRICFNVAILCNGVHKFLPFSAALTAKISPAHKIRVCGCTLRCSVYIGNKLNILQSTT